MSTPNRWSDVSRIYHQAAQLPPPARGEFVAQACGDDPELQAEVSSLLECHSSADPFLQAQAASLAVEIDASETLIGRTLGSYRIDAPLGAGGMGEVYRATDLRLDRPVAVKILPPHIRRDPDLRRQFEHEARAVAALRHPNICVLHDVGSDDTLEFMVMEYLEGETLAARLARGPLSMDDACRYALDIGAALVETHRRGVVHRDLKPGNIMLTPTGAKLLDFGIATLRAAGTDTAPPLSPLVGILGTPCSMSPEQLAGHDADARTDVFAFGAILYEMVVGRKAFEDLTRVDQTAAAVQPRALRHIVRTCLRFDPRQRFPSAAALVDEVRSLERRRSSNRGVRVRTAASLVVGSLVAASGWLWQREPAGPAPTTTFRDARLLLELETRPGSIFISSTTDATLSSDDRFAAYIGRTATGAALFVRSIADGRSRVLVETRQDVLAQPRFSPDGRFLAYLAPGGVFVVPASGGTPWRVDGALNSEWMYVARLQPPALAGSAAWSPDGRRLAIAARGTLAIVSPTGAAPVFVVRDYSRELHSCDWSPKGQWIACLASAFRTRPATNTDARGAIVIVPVSGDALPRQITADLPGQRTPVWSADGQWLYFVSPEEDEANVYRIRIDANGEPAGGPQRLTSGLQAQGIALSRTQIAYSTRHRTANIWSVPIAAPPADLAQAQRLTAGDQAVEAIAVSGTGGSLLYTTRGSNSAIFKLGLDGTPEQLASRSPEDPPYGPPPGISLANVFAAFRTASPNRRSVAYVQPRRGQTQPQVFVVDRDEHGTWTNRREVPNAGWPVSWAPQSDFIAYPKHNGIDLYWPASGVQRRIYEPTIGRPRAVAVAVSSTGTVLAFKTGETGVGGSVTYWQWPIAGASSPTLLLRGDPDDVPRILSTVRPLLSWGDQDLTGLLDFGAGLAADFAIAGDRLYFTRGEFRNRVWVAPLPR